MGKPTIQLPVDFKEFIELLNSERVEYLLVGGYAVGIYGAPRFTHDLDIWVRVDSTNATKLGRVLEQFGFREAKLTSGQFLKPGGVFRFGVPPLQIDILSEVTGCHFTESYSRRNLLLQDGVDLSIISLDDLKANKRAAGRPKDLSDLDGLDQPGSS